MGERTIALLKGLATQISREQRVAKCNFCALIKPKLGARK